MTSPSIRLEAPSASGRKFYEIAINPKASGFTVDFQYGAVGDTPRTGTKTPKPVSADDAQRIFDKLVREKQNSDSQYRPVHVTAIMEMIAPKVSLPCAAVVPQHIPPRLLNDVDEDDILTLIGSEDWWMQIKHDGDRVQLHAVDGVATLFSGRTGRVRACPKAIVDAVAIAVAMSDRTFVLDGELVGETLHVFDLLKTAKRNYMAMPYASRYDAYHALVPAIQCPTIKPVLAAKDARYKSRMAVRAKRDHEEGVVFIRQSAIYRPGRPNRGGDNLRWKFTASASLIVHSHNHAKGKESINVRLYDGTVIGTCSVIGKPQLPKVGAVVEVEYLYAQGSLVQARLKGIRTDVKPTACTRAQLKFKDGIDPLKATRLQGGKGGI